MSSLPSSSDVSPAEPMQVDQMRLLLSRYLDDVAPANPLQEAKDRLRDPFQDGKDGRFRINPLWVIVGAMAILTVLVFAYFSTGSL